MSVFFNGRLWTTPASMTVVDDSAMHNNNLSVGNVVALIGHSTGGAPKTPLRFRSAAEARSVLRSGDLLTAVEKALHPSNQSAGPSYVVAMRVDPALQSSAILAGTGNESMIELLSTGYGVWTQQIQVKVENGSSGETGKKKITTRFGSTYYTADDVGRNAFSVEYSGSGASPTIDISTTSIELKVAGSSVASIDLNSFDKVSQLVDHISSVSGFVASVLEGSGDLPLVNSFETVSGADAADYTVTANRYEAVRWFNSISEGLVDATMLSLNANVITNLSNTADDGFVSLTGGVNGSSVATDWNDCFSALQTEDVQWVVPVTADASVHAMADTHCSFMSDVVQNERRAIVGTATGTTDEAAISAALAINSDRTSLVHLGFYDYATDGSTVLREPYILAALLAGMFSGVNPGTALTNKSINVRGLERKLRNPTDTDRLINGGVFCVEQTSKGFKVVRSISTWITNQNYNRVEVSVGTAVDYVARNVREAVDDLRGWKGAPETLAIAKRRATAVLEEMARSEPYGAGILAGDDASPPFKDVVASLEGDVMRVEFQCSPVIPVNYIPITIFAVPYSGSTA